MRYARIYPWRRTHRSGAPSNVSDAFFVAQFSAGYTTNMFGFDLRQGQGKDRSAGQFLRREDALRLRHHPQAKQKGEGLLSRTVCRARRIALADANLATRDRVRGRT